MGYRFILKKGDYQLKVVDTDTGKLIKVRSVIIDMQVDNIITADMEVLLYDGDEIDIEIPKECVCIKCTAKDKNFGTSIDEAIKILKEVKNDIIKKLSKRIIK